MTKEVKQRTFLPLFLFSEKFLLFFFFLSFQFNMNICGRGECDCNHYSHEIQKFAADETCKERVLIPQNMRIANRNYYHKTAY